MTEASWQTNAITNFGQWHKSDNCAEEWLGNFSEILEMFKVVNQHKTDLQDSTECLKRHFFNSKTWINIHENQIIRMTSRFQYAKCVEQ